MQLTKVTDYRLGRETYKCTYNRLSKIERDAFWAEWDMICEKLNNSGVDLSRIVLVQSYADRRKDNDIDGVSEQNRQ